MGIPTVQGIAPKLTVGGEPVGRTSRHSRRPPLPVQQEQIGTYPNVNTVGRHVDRKIPDDPNPPLVRIRLQLPPLLPKVKLKKPTKCNLLRQLPSASRQRIVIPSAKWLVPLLQRQAPQTFFDCQKERKILQPPRLVRLKYLLLGTLSPPASLKRQAKQGHTDFVLLPIVHAAVLTLQVGTLTLLHPQKPFLTKTLQADKIRIPRKSGKGLIGRIPHARHSHGKDLPKTLPRCRKEIHKFVRLTGKAPDPVSGWQGKNRQ